MLILSKDDTNEACQSYVELETKKVMAKSSKLTYKIDENFEMKEYFRDSLIHQTRAMFRSRCKMFQCKMNFPNIRKFSKDLCVCDSCRRAVDTQSHVMICPAYAFLREGKDVNSKEDVVQYLAEVMKIRTKEGFIK